ncbi:hypothetical protein RFI_26940 [Reticulomyxa filosa]|uniref:RNA-dependent RNA polymerase n=1 Tax=Reticulomyxa filosa TaxID=46433 RepID=X6M992_RETFI|nr:hypothetical protein RFI_26940 [Reticulomyxa filosa]|eukprot:ETO10439.1 hypothetical protein RFI_26940 [Reticulomyxa filosa]
MKKKKEVCFSDGVGRISSQFAARVAGALGLKDVPSAFQKTLPKKKKNTCLDCCYHVIVLGGGGGNIKIRFGGAKGVVTLHPRCKTDLQLRPSMIKFPMPEGEECMFEVCRSSFFSSCYLNRQVITIIETLNPESQQVLANIAKTTLDELKKIKTNVALALNYVRSRVLYYSYLTKRDISSPLFILYEVIKAGFGLDNPFLCLQYEVNEIRDKQRIFIEDGASLLGVMDEYGILEEEKFLSKFRAVNKSALHHLKNVIMMSGSDLDGDVYWVTWDPRLLRIFPSENYKPLQFPDPVSKEVAKVTIQDLQEFFIDYVQNDCLGILAHAHLAQADKQKEMAKSLLCIRLAALHSLAVDFRKSGVPINLQHCSKKCIELLPSSYPDFMHKHKRKCYQSEKALGKIYQIFKDADISTIFHTNFIRQFVQTDPTRRKLIKSTDNYSKLPTFLRARLARLVEQMQKKIDFFDKIVRPVITLYREYQKEMESIQNRFEVATEIELFMNKLLFYSGVPGLKEFEAKNKIYIQVNIIKMKFRGIFFRDFAVKELIQRGERFDLADAEIGRRFTPSSFTTRMKNRAALWYWVSQDGLVNYPEVALGFPFTVYDVLCAE